MRLIVVATALTVLLSSVPTRYVRLEPRYSRWFLLLLALPAMRRYSLLIEKIARRLAVLP